jgi:dipeptidyl aminopeptidase/acylaminoacyl peptidase
VQLTAGPVPFYGATTLSADGKQLFVVGIQPRVELVHYESSSKQFTPFLGGISAEELEVSRNGQWVAYTTVPEFNLWRSKLDGSERLQLTFPPMKAHEPRWSPDGTQILFTHQPNNDIASKIFVVPADGGAPKQLMPEEHPDEIGAGAWLPDGNSIVFSRLMGCGPAFESSCVYEKYAIYKLDLKNQHVSKIPGSDGMYSARVSRDGRYVTALSTNQKKVMLYDFHTEGWSEITQANSSINWSHDSKFAYLVRKQEGQPAELVRISVPEGKVERVLDLRDVTLGGFWPDWISLLPDDSPLLMLDRSRPEVYRLELQYH